MLYLLWSLINIGLFVFFIAICFKATKLLREKLGLFTAIIFVFGLLSFIGHSNNQNSNQIRTWKFTSEDSLKSNESYLLDIDIKKNLISKYDLLIEYGKAIQEDQNIPISTSSSTTGFISGTNWKPLNIQINRTIDNKKFEYFVNGVIQWQLLGAIIFSQYKTYEGIALIE
ncbi:MAG: hypothetical protein ABIP79_15115 [Chitinophagaceae bacterium]